MPPAPLTPVHSPANQTAVHISVPRSDWLITAPTQTVQDKTRVSVVQTSKLEHSVF